MVGTKELGRGGSTVVAMLLATTLGAQDDGRLVGHVVGPLGEPVPAAEVIALASHEDAAVVARMRTDGEGMFVLGGLPASVTLTARGEGLIGPAVVVPIVPADTPVELPIFECAAVRGLVLDPRGQPLAGAHVSASYGSNPFWSDEPPRTATTDEHGRFELDDVPLGWIDLDVFAPGPLTGDTGALVPAGGVDVELHTVAQRATRLDVHVDGLGADDHARIDLQPVARGHRLPPQLARGTTDEGGDWHAADLPDYRFQVRVRAEGYAIEPDLRGFGPGARACALEFRAVPRATPVLRGRLRQVDGTPLAHETVVCGKPSGQELCRRVTSDDGAFVLPSPPDVDHVAFVLKGDWALRPSESSFARSPFRTWSRQVCRVPCDESIELTAVPACQVAGQVRQTNGRPAAFVPVVLEASNQLWQPFARGTTDEQGRFVIGGIRPFDGDVRVRVDCAKGTVISHTFSLHEGPFELPEVLRLLRAATVTGCVRSSHGEPLPGVAIELLELTPYPGGGESTVPSRDEPPLHVVSNRDGRYRFLGVPAADYRIHSRLGPHGGQPVRITTEGGKTLQQDLTIAF